MKFLKLYSVYERFTGFFAAMAAFLCLLMSVWITYDVLSRSLLGWASPWSFDLSEYALVWITFLAAPWILMNDRHIRIELLVDVLPIKAQRLFGIVVCLAAIGTCAVLAWRTGIAAADYYTRGDMMARIWRIPRIYPYAVIPFGSALLTIAFIFRLGLYIRTPNPEADLKARAARGQETGDKAQDNGK